MTNGSFDIKGGGRGGGDRGGWWEVTLKDLDHRQNKNYMGNGAYSALGVFKKEKTKGEDLIKKS